jgi:hypothetical protein
MTLTKLNKEIISPGFAGYNGLYEKLKESKNAYPQANEFRYPDAYVNILNALYSLDDILGKRKEFIKRQSFELTMGSPLRSSEGETLLNYILFNSVNAGLWQPMVIDVPKLTDTLIKTAKEYLERVSSIGSNYNANHMDKGVLFGIARAKQHDFVLPVEVDNKLIIIPSQTFVEYCAERK